MRKNICGNCGKDALERKQVEFEPGFFVEARVCSACGEQWFDHEVVRKIGARARQRERTLIKLGSSLAVTLPPELASKYKLRAGEKVYLLEEEGGIALRPVPA